MIALSILDSMLSIPAFSVLNNLARSKHSVNYKTLKSFSVDFRLGMRIMGDVEHQLANGGLIC